MVLTYVAVALLAMVIVAALAVRWLTRQTEALMPTASSGQVKVDQANYRLYRSSDTAAPGAPLAADNTAAALPQTGASFRVRVGVENKSRALVQVSTSGWNHTCSVDHDKKAHCWGEGVNGALGNGSTSNKYTPVEIDMSGVLAGKTIKQISVGDWNTCAIASDDRVYCWGYGISFGDLGNGTFSQSNVPVAVSTSGVLAGKKIKQVSVGFENVCVVDSGGKAYCWGNGTHGTLGNGLTAISNVPVAVSMSGVLAGKTIKQISVGSRHVCAVASDDRAYCWGMNSSGQLGNNSTSNANVPVAVSTSGVLAGKTIKQITASDFHTCAIASDGEAYCWGGNTDGQLGNNSTNQSNVPVTVLPPQGAIPLLGGQFKQISAEGGNRTCAIAYGDRAYCWGEGRYGGLGNNSTTNSRRPVAVSMSGVLAGKTIKQISSGAYRTCVIASDNQIYCWGRNNHGQFGDGNTVDSLVPTATSNGGGTISVNTMKLRTQYAKKTAATCQAVAAGWQDVTNSSALAYSAAGPNNGTAIAAAANDPSLPSTSVGYSYQSIVRPGSAAQLTFTNSREINAGETGLWDLALTDNGLERNTNYCVRLVADTTAAPGTNIDTYSYYPEFKTADGSLDIRFADAANATLTNPTTVFSAAMTGRTASTTTAKLSNNSSQQLEVANSLSTTGWSVSLAATGGSTAKWTQTGGTASYGFNNSNANQGQLSVDLSSSAFTASGSTPLGQACTTAGLSYGAGGAFVAGTASASAITLATASSSSGLTCLFKLQDISLKQTIPAYQKPGTYTLPVTVTVVAQ